MMSIYQGEVILSSNVRAIADYSYDNYPDFDVLIVTGGGVTLAIDLMFYLLGKFYGNGISQKTAELMEYDRALAANSEFLGVK